MAANDNDSGEETYIRPIGPGSAWKITGHYKLFWDTDAALAHIHEQRAMGNPVCMIRPIIAGESGCSQDFDPRYSDDEFRKWCKSLNTLVRDEYPLEQWAGALIEIETYIESK